MLNRRHLFSAAVGLAGAGVTLRGPGGAAGAYAAGLKAANLRGTLASAAAALRSDPVADQTALLAELIADASRRDEPLALPSGTFVVSELKLPKRLVLLGAAGTTRLICTGSRAIVAQDAEHLTLDGIVFDGRSALLDPDCRGLIDLRGVDRLSLQNCRILDEHAHGLALEGVAGRVERCMVEQARDAGIYALASRGLTIAGNSVADCGNGGILVHRASAGEDGTVVAGNRVARISAAAGGTGQNGNGINVFRADGVAVSGNMLTDCAFSAIRANTAGNVRIIDNTCLRSGETAIYVEFASTGAVVASNIVDDAANGIAMVNFDQGGRLGVCAGNLVRNLRASGPYPADPPGFGIGIAVEADCAVTGNVVRGRRALWRQSRLGSVPAQRGGHRQSDPPTRTGIGVSWPKARARPSSPTI